MKGGGKWGLVLPVHPLVNAQREAVGINNDQVQKRTLNA